jgi:hypothetical protein
LECHAQIFLPSSEKSVSCCGQKGSHGSAFLPASGSVVDCAGTPGVAVAAQKGANAEDCRIVPYPRQHAPAEALKEIGRVERALVIIDRVLDADMQRRAQTSLLSKGRQARLIVFVLTLKRAAISGRGRRS